MCDFPTSSRFIIDHITTFNHCEYRTQVAELIGAHPDEVVLVPNTTLGINNVMRNFEWKEGDLVLDGQCSVFAVSYLIPLTLVIASTTYGAISNTLQYLADRGEQPRPIRHTITYTFPATQAEICDNFRAKLQELKSQYPNVTFSDTPPPTCRPQ